MKKISLYYTSGGSDKVYHVQLIEDGAEWRVNFQYGRRGGTLAEGTKTPIPVSLWLAENIFARLVKEKTGKGYKASGEREHLIPAVSPDRRPKCPECGGVIVEGAARCKNCGSALVYA